MLASSRLLKRASLIHEGLDAVLWRYRSTSSEEDSDSKSLRANTDAARDAANGTATSLRVDPALVRDAAQVRAMLAAFGRLSSSSN